MVDLRTRVEQLVASVEQTVAARATWPSATYRLQFRKDALGFRDAARLVPYLAALGVSHMYASPYFQTPPGSTHGYSAVDPNQLNPELGSPEDYQFMVAALHEHGLGHLLDLVPNHMSIESDGNRWWHDVLENGPGSPFAAYFDIDWEPVKEELANRILLPMLGGSYGEVLEAGHIRLHYADGAFQLRVYDHSLPLDPTTFTPLLTHRLADLQQVLPEDGSQLRELQSIVTALEHLPDRNDVQPDRIAERQREKEVIKDRLARLTSECAAVRDFVASNVELFNGNAEEPRSFDQLDQLLNAQVYRLSHWRTASDEINYRRFFDVNELAALCMEKETVFEASHRLLFDLLARGDVEGVRVDHVDGLFDPTEYLWRLQWGYLRALGRAQYEETRSRNAGNGMVATLIGEPSWTLLEPLFLRALSERLSGPDPAQLFPATTFNSPLAAVTETTIASGPFPPAVATITQQSAGGPLYIVVERILGPDEPLPADWPVAGTTGYDFLNCLAGLFVDRAGLRELRSIYRRFVGDRSEFRDVAYHAKVLILRVAMASELQMLARRLNRISERHRRFRDLTLNTLRVALRETLAHFPVYRTYIGQGGISDRDRRVVQRVMAAATRSNPALSPAAFDFLRGVLLLEQPPNLDEAGCRERELFVGRFQQVTSPAMAKGLEDTAFYRWLPLVSRNEVGGDPAEPPTSVESFHRENLARRAQHPAALLATSTHDTKCSEDVRARISVLSEIPQRWRAAVNRWARLNRRFRTELEGLPAPSRNDEYLFYQALVGVWPLAPPNAAERDELIQRLQRHLEKAAREAKVRTSWINPDANYEAALRQFAAATLADDPKNRFLADFTQFHEQIVDAGLYAALAQAFLKLTSPGVPDIYQGQELWNFSLVDPDNRRSVDFDCARQLLSELQTAVDRDEEARFELARQLAVSPRDPRLKLYVTWQTLQFRRRYHELWKTGDYIPLSAEGPCAEHVCAFAWRAAASGAEPLPTVIIVAPRLIIQLLQSAGADAVHRAPLGPELWRDTALFLDGLVGLQISHVANLFTGETRPVNDRRLSLALACGNFPVALLTAQTE
jgi:(1->4)-alpha-D-glucan 1-alpha-D-glucosylmutase